MGRTGGPHIYDDICCLVEGKDHDNQRGDDRGRATQRADVPQYPPGESEGKGGGGGSRPGESKPVTVTTSMIHKGIAPPPVYLPFSHAPCPVLALFVGNAQRFVGHHGPANLLPWKCRPGVDIGPGGGGGGGGGGQGIPSRLLVRGQRRVSGIGGADAGAAPPKRHLESPARRCLSRFFPSGYRRCWVRRPVLNSNPPKRGEGPRLCAVSASPARHWPAVKEGVRRNRRVTKGMGDKFDEDDPSDGDPDRNFKSLEIKIS